MPPDPWADQAHLRAVQYKTDANLAARQSIYAFQDPPVDLPARVLDLAAPAESDTIADIGCGNGRYLAELARRGFQGRVVGADMSSGMLQAARDHLNAAAASRAAYAAGSVAATVLAAAASAALSPPLAPIALVSADATALPLRDGAADLTIAAHMLYHVPEPADAFGELRRITCPGGRVIIVLNSAAHLRQLRAAIAAARGLDPAALAERLTLDDGEALASSFFPRVIRHEFPAELHIPDPAPIADYIRSLPDRAHDASAGPAAGSALDPDALIEAVLVGLTTAPDGHYVITTHAGCLIAERE